MKANVALLVASFSLPSFVADDDVATVFPKSRRDEDESPIMNNTATTKKPSSSEAFVSVPINDENRFCYVMTLQRFTNHGVAETVSQRIMDDESLIKLPSHLSDHYHEYEDNKDPPVWNTEHLVYSQNPPYSSLSARYTHQQGNHVVTPHNRPFSEERQSNLLRHQGRCGKRVSNRTDRVSPSPRDEQQSGPVQEKSVSPALSGANQSVNFAAKHFQERENGTTTQVNTTSQDSDLSPRNNTQAAETVSAGLQASSELSQIGIEKTEHQQKKDEEERVVVDYAGKSSGALVIEKSTGWKGTSNLLTADHDQYAMVPAEAKRKFLIISLSEEILVEKVVLANYERYSSYVKEFQILGSQTMATWADMGNYTAKSGKFGRQEFELKTNANWARYLKFRFISHYGDEHYLTITQISVHGRTMQQGFHEHWDERREHEEEDDRTLGVPNGTKAVEGQSEKRPSSSASIADLSVSDTSTNLTIENSTAFRTSSSCLYRGIGQNGYFLFSWVMPLSKKTTACPCARLSSALVPIHSTSGTNPISGWPDLTTPIVDSNLIPENFRRFPRRRAMRRALLCDRASPAPPQLKDDFILSPTLVVRPCLDVRETPRAVAMLLDLIKEKDLSGNFLFDNAKNSYGKDAHTPNKTSSSMDGKEHPQNSSGQNDEAKIIMKREADVNSSSKLTTKNSTESKPEENVSSSSVLQLSLKEQGSSVNARVLEESLPLQMLIERIPSAACLKELNITNYKSSRSASSRVSATASNGPSGGAMEPIFKKLTDEIKSLQASLSAHDKFAKDSVSCFQRVLTDLLIRQDQELAEQNRRLEKMERILNGGHLYSTMWDHVSALGTVVSASYYYLISVNLVAQVAVIPWSETYTLISEWVLSSRLGCILSILGMVTYRFLLKKHVRSKASI